MGQFSACYNNTIISQYSNQMKVIDVAYGGIKFSSLEHKHKEGI